MTDFCQNFFKQTLYIQNPAGDLSLAVRYIPYIVPNFIHNNDSEEQDVSNQSNIIINVNLNRDTNSRRNRTRYLINNTVMFYLYGTVIFIIFTIIFIICR
jgi:hypothetical protein